MRPYSPGCHRLHETPANQRQRGGWGVHTLRGGIDPVNHHSCSQVVGGIGVWKDIWSGDGALSSPGGGGSTSLSKSVISQWGWGFPHRTGRYRPGWPLFLSSVCWYCRGMEGFTSRRWGVILRGCGGTLAFPRGTTLAACPAHPHWAGSGDGGSSTHGIRARETLYFYALAYRTRY